MNRPAPDLSAVFAPATTAFQEGSGDIDLDAMRSNAMFWLHSQLGGLVLFGSTGEGLLLQNDERITIIEAIRGDHAETVLLAGAGAESTRRTIELCRLSARAGADGVLVHPPAYYRPLMTPEVLRKHFTAVADASPIPVVLYQVPTAFSGIALPVELVVDLSAHENIIGIKDSSGDVEALAALVDRCEPSFQVLVGSGAALLDALGAGAAGAILGVAVLAPAEASRIQTLFDKGDLRAARDLQERIATIHREIVAQRGVPGVKMALDLLGHHGGAPRPPLQPLASSEAGAVVAILETGGLLGTSARTA